MTDVVTLFITTASSEEARKVARALLEKRLAACASIVPGVDSLYWWQGAIEEAQEWLLVVKTRQARVEALVAEVKGLHSYAVPEIIALPVVEGNPDYLAWVRSETATSDF